MRKKLLLAVICVLLIPFGIAMTGCGSGGTSGETYDAGNISCTVPDGWKVFTSEELFTTEVDSSGEETAAEEEADPNSIYIYKGAEKTADIATCNGMTILYSPDGLLGSFDEMKSAYENVKEQKPLKLGDYEWKWFTSKLDDGEFEYAIMATESGDAGIEIQVVLKNGENTISMDDEDVKSIIESIKITAADETK